MKKYKQYLKIPFKHCGRDREGLDCYGLVMLWFKEQYGVDLKDWWYEEKWSKKGNNYFLDNYEDYNFVKVDTPQKDDVVLFTMDIHSSIPNHASIVVKPPNIAISAEKCGVVLVDLNRNILKRRIQGFYRLCQN